MSNIAIEQIWFQKEYAALFFYVFVIVLPAVLLLLDSIYKPKWNFYEFFINKFKLTEASYRNICIGLLVCVIGGYVVSSFRSFTGIGILPNRRVEFYYYHPARNRVIDFSAIDTFRIIPYKSRYTNAIGFLEIQLKGGGKIKSILLLEEDREKFDMVIRWLETDINTQEKLK